MSEALATYRRLAAQLLALRTTREPGSAEEDPLLESMDQVWWSLSEEECLLLDAEVHGCWPDMTVETGLCQEIEAAEATAESALDAAYAQHREARRRTR